jgi:hypothetical protein
LRYLPWKGMVRAHRKTIQEPLQLATQTPERSVLIAANEPAQWNAQLHGALDPAGLSPKNPKTTPPNFPLRSAGVALCCQLPERRVCGCSLRLRKKS